MKLLYKNLLWGTIGLTSLALIGNFAYQRSHTQENSELFEEHEEGEGAENRQEEVQKRLHEEFLKTNDPRIRKVPTERLIDAKEWIAQRDLSPNGPDGILANISWQERGPNNVAGRIRSFFFDSRDASSNTVYAGSVSGGLWRTTNFKTASPTWTQITSISQNLAITTLAQDPSNANTMYAGTGEGYLNFDAVRGLGIYKSTDGGNNWSLLASTTVGGVNYEDFNYVQKIIVNTDGSVYASGISDFFCNRGGILKSTNGGTSWTRVIGSWGAPQTACNTANDFYGYDIERASNGDLYATTQTLNGPPYGKVWRSPAGASVGNVGTWVNITPAAPASGWYQRIELAPAPSNSDRVYALFQGNNNIIETIKRYSVASGTWTTIDNNTLWCDQGSSTSTDFSRGQAWYDLIAAVQPNNDNVVLAGGVDWMKSSDAGANWSQLTQWASGCGTLPVVHADQHYLQYLIGSSSEFAVANDGGMYYTADNGATFGARNTSLRITQFYSIALHPTAGSQYMIGGTQDNGTHRFTASGINNGNPALSGDGGFSFIDQTDGVLQVGSFTGSQYVISRNSGTNFSFAAFFGGADRFINPTDYDNTQNLIYASHKPGRFLRIGNIAAGTPDSTGFTFTGNLLQHSVSAVKVDPNTANRVFFALSTANAANGPVTPVLFYANNANATPTFTQVSLPGTITSGDYISCVEVENGDPNHLLLTISNYGSISVYESLNLGGSWTALDGGSNLPDVPVRWAIFLPAGTNPGNAPTAIGGIMIATETGVFSTSASNGASTVWTPNSNGFGNVRVDMLDIRPADQTVAVATHGRGVWTGQIFLGAVPVTFKSFTGKAESKLNRLSWSVENEVDNTGYELERRYADGSNFEKVAFIPSNKASTRNTYSFNDQLVDLGKENAYYRLKQIDVDGKFTYSATVQLSRKSSGKFIEYMSADQSTLLLRVNGGNASENINVRIVDGSGRLVRSMRLNYQTQQINISSLSAGTYVVELTNNKGDRFTGRFVH